MSILPNKRKAGVVLPIVLVLIFCGFITAAMLAVQAGRSLNLTRRSLEYQRASVLADSGVGYGLMFVKSEISRLGWAKFLSSYRGKVNTLINDNSASDSLKNLNYNYDRDYRNGVCFEITKEDIRSSTSNEGGIEVVVYSASRSQASDISSAVKETITMSISQLGDYAAFYEYDLEAWPGEDMTFVGKVHSNGDLWIGGDKLMKFERNVTAAGNFYAQRKPDSGYGNAAYVTSSGRVQFRKGNDDDYVNGTKPASYADVINGGRRMDYTGIGPDRWYSQSMSYYGGALQTSRSKLSAPISVDDDPHAIIERRKNQGEDGYNAETEAVKFASKAALTIRIDSKGGLHLYDQSHKEIENPESYMQPAASVKKAETTTGKYTVEQGTYTYVDENDMEKSEKLPAYQVDNYIYDRRDDVPMQPVDIYIDEILLNPKLMELLYPANVAQDDVVEPGVLYVTRDEPEGYPVVDSEEVGTGEYNVDTSTDSQSTTDSKKKDELVKQGYSVTDTKSSTTTKYYIYQGTGTRRKKVETTQSTYNRTSSANRAGTTTTTTTTYYLSKVITTMTEIMKTVAVTNFIPTQPCVRIRNAGNLGVNSTSKSTGLSIATDLPMYVEGAFNTNGGRGQKNDACTDKPPALVAADAVTMLSSAWDDAKRIPNWKGWRNGNITSVRPTENLDSRAAVETTFNGILMTGIVESNGGTYSGGLQNLFRFHEHWRKNGAIPYNFNGSMVCMWLSKIARNPIESNYTYQPPSRPWGWAKMQPPGLPNIMNIQEAEWKRIDISEYQKKDKTY